MPKPKGGGGRREGGRGELQEGVLCRGRAGACDWMGAQGEAGRGHGVEMHVCVTRPERTAVAGVGVAERQVWQAGWVHSTPALPCRPGPRVGSPPVTDGCPAAGPCHTQVVALTWAEVVHRLVLVQRTSRLCIARDLDELGIVARIMRKVREGWGWGGGGVGGRGGGRGGGRVGGCKGCLARCARAQTFGWTRRDGTAQAPGAPPGSMGHEGRQQQTYGPLPRCRPGDHDAHSPPPVSRLQHLAAVPYCSGAPIENPTLPPARPPTAQPPNRQQENYLIAMINRNVLQLHLTLPHVSMADVAEGLTAAAAAASTAATAATEHVRHRLARSRAAGSEAGSGGGPAMGLQNGNYRNHHHGNGTGNGYTSLAVDSNGLENGGGGGGGAAATLRQRLLSRLGGGSGGAGGDSGSRGGGGGSGRRRRRCPPMLTKTLEWNLRWCILDHMFDDRFRIRPEFLDVAALRRRE